MFRLECYEEFIKCICLSLKKKQLVNIAKILIEILLKVNTDLLKENQCKNIVSNFLSFYKTTDMNENEIINSCKILLIQLEGKS